MHQISEILRYTDIYSFVLFMEYIQYTIKLMMNIIFSN